MTDPDVESSGHDQEPALETLLAHLKARHGNAINCVLLYGSCLRSGDIFDGLLDIYLICDDYRSAYTNRAMAATNWLLAPNVFYAEVDFEGKTLHSKYAVISTADFRRGCSMTWFESYIWGRFSQPSRMLYCRDDVTRNSIEQSLLNAARTFLQRTAPLLPSDGSIVELWEGALALSYGSELRTEKSGRAGELARASQNYFDTVSEQLAGSLPFHFQLEQRDGALHYHSKTTASQKRSARFSWRLRKVHGTIMSILRLVKALFTFEGAFDYIVWKLQRHSGQEIIVPDKVRRYPLLFSWGFFWRLYRQGIIG
jgi:hypothetical protein